MLCSLTWNCESENFTLYKSAIKLFYFDRRSTKVWKPSIFYSYSPFQLFKAAFFKLKCHRVICNPSCLFLTTTDNVMCFSQLPITEKKKKKSFLSLIRKLDVGAMREAASLLVGNHDFSSFRAVNSDMPFKNPVKTLDVANIQPGGSFTQAHFYR